MLNIFENIFWILATFLIVFHSIFGPESIFHHTENGEKPELFDRWKQKRLAWNIHQSMTRFIGSTIGVAMYYFLFFQLGISDPGSFTVTHLVLFLIGTAGIMGFLPTIFLGSSFGK